MMVADLPEEIPIFPLTGALLLPGGQLPLNIFEPRYLAMVESALGHGRFIGMVQPREADRETVGDEAAVFETGCLGRISQFSEMPGGQFSLALSGICRFQITREFELLDGYRRVEPNFDGFIDDLSPPAEGLNDRPGLINALRAFFKSNNLDADWDALEQSPDSVLVTSAAMGCPFGPKEKQLLLEAADLTVRAEKLQVILEMAVHDKSGDMSRH